MSTDDYSLALRLQRQYDQELQDVGNVHEVLYELGKSAFYNH